MNDDNMVNGCLNDVWVPGEMDSVIEFGLFVFFISFSSSSSYSCCFYELFFHK